MKYSEYKAKKSDLVLGDRFQRLLMELSNSVFVLAQVCLGAHQQNGHVWSVVVDFWVPL